MNYLERKGKYLEKESLDLIKNSNKTFKNDNHNYQNFSRKQEKVIYTKRKDDDYKLVLNSNSKSINSDLKQAKKYYDSI